MNIQSDLFPSLNQLSADLSLYGKIDHCSSDLDDPSYQYFHDRDSKAALPKKKKFPKQLKAFLQFIPGNDCCPDCEVRTGKVQAPREFNNGLTGGCMPWVNVEYGSLICEECAGYHIRLNRKTSSVMSLDNSTWSLPQIISVLEGGNQNLLKAIKKIDRQDDCLNKNKRGLGMRNLMTEKEKHCHPFEHRYKYNTKIDSYKASLASRVADVCKENGGATFTQENTVKIIPEEEFNNGTSLATYLVYNSKSGKEKKDKATSILMEKNEPDSSQQRRKPSSKEKKRTKSSTRSSEAKAVDNFFHRIFEHEVNQVRQYNETVSSRHYAGSEGLNQRHNVDESKNHPFREQQDHPQRKVRHNPIDIHWDDKGRYCSGHTVKDEKRRHISSKRDLSGWSYEKSLGESKALKQATRRLSIDSMISPILEATENNPRTMNFRSAAA